MTKKIGYLIFFVLVLITRTEHLNSMEQEKEDRTTENRLLQISQSLSTGTEKEIVTDKHSDSSEKEKEEKAQLEIVYNFPGSSGHAVSDSDKTKDEVKHAFLQKPSHPPHGPPPSE